MSYGTSLKWSLKRTDQELSRSLSCQRILMKLMSLPQHRATLAQSYCSLRDDTNPLLENFKRYGDTLSVEEREVAVDEIFCDAMNDDINPLLNDQSVNKNFKRSYDCFKEHCDRQIPLVVMVRQNRWVLILSIVLVRICVYRSCKNFSHLDSTCS